ncbi:hypothetical protein J6590_099475 [Homalodisca vitripennis]|nr:hypothetical protein J6590_099475 [Homalodisca vitripennis]
MKCKSWGRQREIGNDKCSQKLCSKTSIRFCSPNIPGTRETQKRRPRPSSISIGRLSSRALVRPGGGQALERTGDLEQKIGGGPKNSAFQNGVL